MNEEQIKKNVYGTRNESKEDSLWSMVGDFYSKKMRSTAILVWVWGIIFFVPAVYSTIKFFKTDQTKDLILHAVIFICCFNGICLMKIFAWLMIHRHGIKREIQRLKK